MWLDLRLVGTVYPKTTALALPDNLRGLEPTANFFRTESAPLMNT